MSTDSFPYSHFLERLQCLCSEYAYNPYSNTCVRLIRSKEVWEDAQNYCVTRGESLVTLETLESAFWFRSLVKVDPGIGRCQRIYFLQVASILFGSQYN